MSDEVREIAAALLYEGYLLWPYRRSALKNGRRWTFGGVLPAAYDPGPGDGDRCTVLTECLVEAPAGPLAVELRFLHTVRREVRRHGRPVDEFTAAGRRYLPGEEAVERTVRAVGAARTEIEVPAGEAAERLPGGGSVVRSWQGLHGTMAVLTRPILDDVHVVTVEVRNTTPGDFPSRDAALPCAFNSAHLIITAGGRFLSLADPPERLRTAAASCRNVGLWPVPAGTGGDTALAAPIILPDHPRVAPESPGDLFDATEIDQLLTLGLLSLGEEERREIRDGDPRAREILDRIAALSPEDLMRLNGVIREFRPLREA
ncbi:hypothetical protein DPM19_07950 [Actinomadura craniellae]|uniref:Uncharacterized protein n=1 Tax=Actinomadura craniellae TaxID=2231787 RepID=A0A365H9U3_9ACTN|nr:hypothetical protein [Actinomadura craniellae]RAY15706.1 hypothetical protein DPM19_07950 [Actinomadura craniellae]